MGRDVGRPDGIELRPVGPSGADETPSPTPAPDASPEAVDAAVDFLQSADASAAEAEQQRLIQDPSDQQPTEAAQDESLIGRAYYEASEAAADDRREEASFLQEEVEADLREERLWEEMAAEEQAAEAAAEGAEPNEPAGAEARVAEETEAPSPEAEAEAEAGGEQGRHDEDGQGEDEAGGREGREDRASEEATESEEPGPDRPGAGWVRGQGDGRAVAEDRGAAPVALEGGARCHGRDESGQRCLRRVPPGASFCSVHART